MQVPTNTFKQALTEQAPMWGCWAGFATGYATEIVASTGFDWLLIDGEHAPNTLPSILAQLQAVAPYSTAPVVRSVNQDPALIKQLLDIGAQTLMIPMVESGDQRPRWCGQPAILRTGYAALEVGSYVLHAGIAWTTT